MSSDEQIRVFHKKENDLKPFNVLQNFIVMVEISKGQIFGEVHLLIIFINLLSCFDETGYNNLRRSIKF